jgi:DNA modification methylase
MCTGIFPFETRARVHFADARDMRVLPSNSVHLVVTSPPYPMIAMWDAVFAAQSPKAAEALERGQGPQAFEHTHRELDKVWKELFRVLVSGGIACINIGDATRTVRGEFRLYPNHARILSAAMNIGFSVLPDILWRKQTNAPNKFMGSGMLPPGAYVTLEHEYILILRKRDKRDQFNGNDARRASAYFWEERNTWFSDVWFDLKGARQDLHDKETRARSAAFPFDLAGRLVCMYSVMGDTVLDPFTGTGTTLSAALAWGRNFMGFELDPGLAPAVEEAALRAPELAREAAEERLKAHVAVMETRLLGKSPPKHRNVPYGFPVVTNQERDALFPELAGVEKTEDGEFRARYPGKVNPWWLAGKTWPPPPEKVRTGKGEEENPEEEDGEEASGRGEEAELRAAPGNKTPDRPKRRGRPKKADPDKETRSFFED